MTSTILIDIGNSRLKWSHLAQGQLQPVSALDYRQTDFAAKLQYAWATLPAPEKIALASVGQTEIVEMAIKSALKLWPSIEIIKAQTTAEKCGVKNAYRNPEKLGIDRWLALIAVHQHYPANCWIIDCGSAITLDYVLQNGQHQGGLIAPGLNMMQQALTKNTANLPPAELPSVNVPGTSSRSLQAADLCVRTERRKRSLHGVNEDFEHRPNAQGSGAVNLEQVLTDFTEAAVYNGTLLAACGLIEKAVKSKNNGQILLTGGDAQLIARYLQADVLIDPELVLKGLAIYSQNKC